MLCKKDFQEIKDIVNKVVIDAAHTILQGVQTMFDDQNQNIDKRFKKVDERFSHLERKVDNVENHLKDDINGIKAYLSTTVSKKDFNQLREKVDKYYPAS